MKLCDYSLGPGGSGEGGAEDGDGMGCGYRAVTLFFKLFFFRGVRCIVEEEKNAPSDEGPQPPLLSDSTGGERSPFGISPGQCVGERGC